MDPNQNQNYPKVYGTKSKSKSKLPWSLRCKLFSAPRVLFSLFI